MVRGTFKIGPGTLRLALAGLVILFVNPVAAQTPSAANLENQELDKPKLKAGANSFVEGQARAKLEADGYTNVSALMNDKDGIWRGTATKNDKVMDVSVDFQGNIAAR